MNEGISSEDLGLSVRVRRKLWLTQAQLGLLLGVHEMTVSRWERASRTEEPSPYQTALLQAFENAADQDKGNLIARDLPGILEKAGVPAALHWILRGIYG